MKLIEQENGQALVLLRKINRMKTRKNALEIELMRSPINKKINKTEKKLKISLNSIDIPSKVQLLPGGLIAARSVWQQSNPD